MSDAVTSHRKPLIVANWKMNKTESDAESFTKEFLKNIPSSLDRDFAICPPYLSIPAVRHLLKGTAVGLGAQDVSEHASGAYTGDVSASMLKQAGCDYVIIGHSERRRYHKETDSLVNKKIHAALKEKLIPIVCVGERLEEREKNKTLSVVRRQVTGALEDIPSSETRNLVFAYEPVWAIGTGKTATPDQAQEVHLAIRDVIKDQYGSHTSLSVRILYGGSIKPDNMGALMSCEDIDGGLVGGASLLPQSFLDIVTYAVTQASEK